MSGIGSEHGAVLCICCLDPVLSCNVCTIALANGRANVQSIFGYVPEARADIWSLLVEVCRLNVNYRFV